MDWPRKREHGDRAAAYAITQRTHSHSHSHSRSAPNQICVAPIPTPIPYPYPIFIPSLSLMHSFHLVSPQDLVKSCLCLLQAKTLKKRTEFAPKNKNKNVGWKWNFVNVLFNLFLFCFFGCLLLNAFSISLESTQVRASWYSCWAEITAKWRHKQTICPCSHLRWISQIRYKMYKKFALSFTQVFC